MRETANIRGSFMYRTHIVSSVFSLLFGFALLTWVIPAQTPEYPGFGMPASLLPDILAWIIIFCAAAHLLKTLVTGAGKGIPAPISLTTFAHCLAFLLVLAASMPLMRILGYFPGGALVMAACCLLCGERRPVRLAVVAGATLFLVWAALWKGLGVMLP